MSIQSEIDVLNWEFATDVRTEQFFATTSVSTNPDGDYGVVVYNEADPNDWDEFEDTNEAWWHVANKVGLSQ
jgi:hypothetical protein